MSNVPVNGAPGTPGSAGAAGGPGGAAPATNTGTDTSNSATAIGGAGGAGGGGASAGAGGLGGAATAATTTPASVTGGIGAFATATGGAGGDAGTPNAGGSGAAGGDGGIASSTATLTTSVATAGSTNATATGGDGGAASSGAAGGAGAAAIAAATTTDGPGAASSTADATGGNSGASFSGDGVAGATATAKAAATGISATVNAATVGGDGGGAAGAGNTGGNGASLLGTDTVNDSAQATATASSGIASANASATGGHGGVGSAGASGGAGGDASLVNAVAGSSSGSIALVQNAAGGDGGGGAVGGAGGSATTTITNTPTSDPLTATISATGGAGGSGTTGGVGGAAIATLASTTAGTAATGSQDVVSQSADALGGNGGAGSTTGGRGGDANASDSATASGGIGAFSVLAQAIAGSGAVAASNGDATAVADANTQASAVSGLQPATAYAQSTAWGVAGGGSTLLGSGTATATAETANGLLAEGYAKTTGGAGTASTAAATSGGLLIKLTAASSAPTDGQTIADATAENNATPSGAPSNGDNVFAAAGGLSKYASLGANVGAAFNNAKMVVFGTGSLGAAYNATDAGGQVYSSSISWDVDSASLPAGGMLDLGLVSPVGAAGTLTSITFSLTEDGVVVVPATTFGSAGAANTFFTDDLMGLGAAAAGVAGDLNVTATLAETLSGTGDAYGVDFMVGVVPCFAAGTRIRTTRGEVAVEHLRVGDLAICGFGRMREIIWTGHRDVDCARHPAPDAVRPVRILADAFGPGLPVRDVRLSPDHAVFVGSDGKGAGPGVLIPVKYLVNEATVVREPVGHVVYWHVECARHEILLAEGLPVESYLDTGNRDGFVEAELVSLAVDFSIRAREIWHRLGCCPLVEAGPALDRARGRLAERAVALGFVPEPFLFVDIGQVGLLRVVLPAGIARVHLVSACRVPDGEQRRLGAAIGAVAVEGVSLPLGDAALASGFYAIERGAGDAYRWTDGEAVLRFAPADRPRELAIRVSMLVRPADAKRRNG